MFADRSQAWTVACQSGEGWTGERTSVAWPRTQSVTSSTRRERVRVRH
jgi:hypothetical protein